MNQSRRYQDSQACDDSSLSFRMGGSAHEVGRFNAGNEEEALEMKEGSKKVLNLSSPVSVPGDDDSYAYSIPRQKRRRKKKKKSQRNMPDSIGRDDSEVNAASSPLVRGSVNQSRRDQDSQACDNSSLSFEMGGSAHEVGRFSAGNEDEALELKEDQKRC